MIRDGDQQQREANSCFTAMNGVKVLNVEEFPLNGKRCPGIIFCSKRTANEVLRCTFCGCPAQAGGCRYTGGFAPAFALVTSISTNPAVYNALVYAVWSKLVNASVVVVAKPFGTKHYLKRLVTLICE